jgi:hypothetical protein
MPSADTGEAAVIVGEAAGTTGGVATDVPDWQAANKKMRNEK